MSKYEKFLGIPYKFNGNDRLNGYDCITLVHHVAREDGIYIPNVNHQSYNIDTFAPIFNLEIASGKWEKVEQQEKVAVVFRIGGVIKHIGYMIDYNKFIHIMKDQNVAIESLKSPTWEKRIAGFYKWVGNE